MTRAEQGRPGPIMNVSSELFWSMEEKLTFRCLHATQPLLDFVCVRLVSMGLAVEGLEGDGRGIDKARAVEPYMIDITRPEGWSRCVAECR